MRIKIHAKELTKALSRMCGTEWLLEAKDYLVISGAEAGLVIKSKVECYTEAGSARIDAKVLPLLKTLNEEVDIVIDKDIRINGKYTFPLLAPSPVNYTPETPIVSLKAEFIPLDSILFSNELGVHFSSNKNLVVAGTDGFNICEIEVAAESTGEASCSIPAGFLRYIPTNDAQIDFLPSSLLVKSPSRLVSIPILAQKFPNYRSAFYKPSKTATANKEELKTALTRCLTIQPEFGHVSIDFDKGIVSSSFQGFSVSEDVAMTGSGRIEISGTVLSKVLDHVNVMTFQFSDNKPVLITERERTFFISQLRSTT